MARRISPVPVIAAFALGSVLLAYCGAQAAPQARRRVSARPAQATVRYERDLVPLFRKYCVACHGANDPKAGINFLNYRTEAAVQNDRETWEKVLHVLRGHIMPPKGLPQPTPAERARMVAWISRTLEQLQCDLRDPGRVTLRRLNRYEYNQTIRDLFGIDLRPADDFPSDDVGYGFDHIGDVLSISPLLMEKYLAAAEKVVRAATVAPEDRQGPVTRYEAERPREVGGSGTPVDWFRLLGSNSEAYATHLFPRDGEYVLRARVFGQQLGDQTVRMALRLDGKALVEREVPQGPENPQLVEVRLRVAAGRRRVGAALLNEYQEFDPGPVRDERRRPLRSRNLAIDYLEVQGPVIASDAELPESHRRIFIAMPTGPADTRECARKILTNFARRAFRRPPTADEVERLIRYVELAQKEGESFERGIQLALQACLVSPHFLFRVEVDAAPGDPKAVRHLNDFELASRLSYFLWSSMPDDELLAVAEKGLLKNPAVLQAQALRMLQDPKAFALVENFGEQWLTLRTLPQFSPNPRQFPAFDEELRQAMLKETHLFLASVFQGDGSLLDLIDADYTFLNERLARHYGIPGIEGEEFRRVKLTGPAREQRGGVLTQASVLAVTSNPTRTSPVKRGKWVLEQLLGTPPPPPPPDVPELEEPKEGQRLTGTLRQRMEQHMKDPLCASCHSRMDPLGFGLENYDAIGAWRTQDEGYPIDASGVLPDGKSFNGSLQLRRVLLTQKEQFLRAFTEKLLTYALGRGVQPADRCVIDEIARRVAARRYRFSVLVAEIVKSEPFRMRRGG